MPVLFLVGVLAIGASLLKLAFFDGEENSPTNPDFNLENQVVEVTKGSLVNTMDFSGTVTSNPQITVKSTLDGTVTKVRVSVGSKVTKGQVLATVKKFSGGSTNIVASSSGEIISIDVLKNQGISIGSPVVVIQPDRYHLVAPVQAVQLYRLLNVPSNGTIFVQGGPAPFECSALKVSTSNEGGANIQCSIPAGELVFPGLPATLSITVDAVEDTLVIPATAVRGGAGSGIAYVVIDAETQTWEERTVELGISDGFQIQVLSGLSEGELILEYAPGVVTQPGIDPGCWTDEYGNIICDGGFLPEPGIVR